VVDRSVLMLMLVADLNDRPVWVQEVLHAAGAAVWWIGSDISVVDQLWSDWYWRRCTGR